MASALLAHGVHQTSTSIKLGRPRGIAAAWAEDPNSLVQVEEPFPEPMLLATTIELTDGLAARGIPGQGRLAEVADSARYDARHVHADLLVVGAGPTGLTAALTAARSGARVVLVDEQSEAGGSLLGTDDRIDGSPALDWVQRAAAELASLPEVLHLQRTTAFGHFDDGFVLALERRTDHLGSPPRVTGHGSGSGASAPGTCSSRRGPTSAPSCSPTTIAPASCSPAARARSCTATAYWPAVPPSCSPPTTARTPRRSISPTPASRCAPSSTRGRSRPRSGGPHARVAASRSEPGASSPAPTASSG